MAPALGARSATVFEFPPCDEYPLGSTIVTEGAKASRSPVFVTVTPTVITDDGPTYAGAACVNEHASDGPVATVAEVVDSDATAKGSVTLPDGKLPPARSTRSTGLVTALVVFTCSTELTELVLDESDESFAPS